MVQTRSHRSVSPKARGKEAPMLPIGVEPEVQRVQEHVYQKAHIPKALREQVWIQHYGTVFHNKCPTRWCQNRVNVFDFQVGHNVPESKGGSTTIDNLIPICGRCNLSMSNTYTFDEWSQTFGSRKRTWVQFFCQCCVSSKKE
jgi:5-methylcytosine-specific restriction endonuclease McrA